MKMGYRYYLSDLLFTFFSLVFFNIALQLGWLLILELLISSIVFIFSGNFESILQQSLEKSMVMGMDFFTPDVWKLNSGLKGLDFIINWFIGLQYSVIDRWMLFAICSGIAVTFFAVGIFFDFEIIEKSSNPKTPKDISIVSLFSLLAALAFISPIFWGGLTGFWIITLEIFKFI